MFPFIKKLWLMGPLAVVAVGLQSAWGFSLLGPLPGSGNPSWTGPGGETWQTAEIGYAFPGDVGGPHNIGEEYRRNVPVYYYTYEASFLDFFGSNGVVAIDGAFSLMNNVFTNNPTGVTRGLDGYSADLSEFPFNSQHINYQAQALGLTDLKSTTLSLLVEQLGLAEPERFVWTLHDRLAPAGCPFTTSYLVVQRNFDVVNSPLNQIQYSSYINGTLYSYFIQEFCSGTPFLSQTVPFPVDPLADNFTTVASFGAVFFGTGGYYTGLTRDDVGGLRYLLTTNNLNIEDVGAGALLLTTNFASPQLITTLPFGLFVSQLTNDPATLQALYPSLIITTTTTNFYLTNITALVPTFTNFPGATTTNFGPLQLLFNFDLGLFSSLAKTSAPPVLQALYPDLLILSSSIASFTTVSNPIVVVYLTNQIGAPAGSPPRIVTVTNGYTFSFITNYNYTFGNILTNFFSPSNQVTIQTIIVTNLIGAPAGSPQSTNVTSVTKFLTNNISGDFFLIPTNWCGFSIQATQVVIKVPSYTNIVVDTGTTNAFGTAQGSQNTIFYYTNRIYAVYPGICEPTLIFTTNTISFVVTNYQYSFANLFTNLPTLQFTNSPVTIITTNIGPCSNGIDGTLCTNVTIQNTTLTNVPSGDFFIVPAAWTCGFNILQVAATNKAGITNITVTPVPPGVTNIGQQFSVTTILIFTNHTLLIQPLLCQTQPEGARLRQGIEKIKFVRADFDSLLGQFFQPITNDYTMNAVTNSQLLPQRFRRIVTTPDFLLSAQDLADNPGNQTIGESFVARTMIYDQTRLLPGLRGPGLINSPTTFTYNKVGDIFFNGPGIFLLTTNNFLLSEFTQTRLLAWGSFDSSTNDPVVYPNGTSIQNLVNQVLIQISPSSLPNGTAGTPYSATFTSTGGAFSPPYTWSLASGSGPLPPGLALSSGGTISGTPTQVGTFNFVIQLTDSLSRTVQWNYSITIQ